MNDVGEGITSLCVSSISDHFKSEYVLENICSFLCEYYEENREIDSVSEASIIPVLRKISNASQSSKTAHFARGALLSLGINDRNLFLEPQTDAPTIFRETGRFFADLRLGALNTILDKPS